MLTTKQIEDLFSAATRVSTLATQAADFLHHKFPPDVAEALKGLSLVVEQLEPLVRGRQQARVLINEMLHRVNNAGEQRLDSDLDIEFLRVALETTKKLLEVEHNG